MAGERLCALNCPKCGRPDVVAVDRDKEHTDLVVFECGTCKFRWLALGSSLVGELLEKLPLQVEQSSTRQVPRKVFLLMSDSDGTLHSIPTPENYAVTTEAEARRWQALRMSYEDDIRAISVFDTLEEASEFDDTLKKVFAAKALETAGHSRKCSVDQAWWGQPCRCKMGRRK